MLFYVVCNFDTEMNFLLYFKVIHRDLKLGNVLLNDDLDVKLGDFGLATRVETDGEKKRYLKRCIVLQTCTCMCI